MITITDPAQCSGCGACASACPVRAISMEADRKGFLYPKADPSICVGCGKCEALCPISNAGGIRPETPMAYGAWSAREEIRSGSSSGGAFTEIAAEVLRQGGIVFGAAFDEDLSVRHIGVETEADLEKLRGSKYVQSTIGTAYLDAKKHLTAGRIVLFTGTPCQIAGLYRFLGREYENLHTQDIICHGVPAPAVWRAYIEYLETAAASRMRTAGFRHKKYGWKNYSVRCSFSNGTSYVKRHSDDLYMQSFHRDLCLRPSCYRCAFKTTARISDITLADFWGVEKVCPEIDDDRGVSLVILHSLRGRALFHRAEGALCFREADLEEAVKYNSAMTRSVPVSADRDAFMECVLENGFCGKAQRFLRPPLKSRIKKALKKLIR